MGPAGSGKTAVGQLLAAELGWEFLDADDFHSPANRSKMAQGHPLNDEDRQPWLNSIHESLLKCSESQENVVLACSALKQTYRDQLSGGLETRVLYLKGSRELLLERLRERKGHFFRGELLDSQMKDLEEPATALTLDIRKSTGQLIQEIREKLNLK
jgi:gluconokinase